MSCKDVCIVADYDCGPEVYNEEIRRAAKPHKCDECGETIAKGQSHQYVSGKWDGFFDTYRTCLVCVEIRKVFGCDGFVLSMLWEDMREQIFPSWERNELEVVDCLARLTTDEAIAKTRAMYAKYREDQA